MAEANEKKDQKLSVVYVTSGQLNGQIIKSKLEAEGIPVILQYESAGVVYGLTVDGMGAVRVLVPERYRGQATESLEGLHI